MQLLIVLGSIIVLLLIIAAVLPKSVNLKAGTTIQAPKQVVFDYVKLLKNQENYSVRVMQDPEVELSYSGTDGTVGFIAARKSDDKNVGIGEQEIVKLVEGESYEVELRFEQPMQATNYAATSVEAISETETKVVNTFRGYAPRPTNLLSYLFLGKVRQDMQQNLENLKNILEQ